MTERVKTNAHHFHVYYQSPLLPKIGPDLSYQSQQSKECSRPVTCERTNNVMMIDDVNGFISAGIQ